LDWNSPIQQSFNPFNLFPSLPFPCATSGFIPAARIVTILVKLVTMTNVFVFMFMFWTIFVTRMFLISQPFQLHDLFKNGRKGGLILMSAPLRPFRQERRSQLNAVGDRWLQVEKSNWNNVFDDEIGLVDNDPGIQTDFRFGLLKCQVVIG
jgi:hypothetical protein